MRAFTGKTKAAAVLLCALLAATQLAWAAGAMDNTRLCSLEVGMEVNIEGVAPADVNVQAGLYRVAAVDTEWRFTAEVPFGALELAGYVDYGPEALQKTAAQAQEIAAEAEPAPAAEAAFTADGTAAMSGLPAGLYLLLMTAEDTTGTTLFEFAPVLVALPSMAPDGSTVYDLTDVKPKFVPSPAKGDLQIIKTLESYNASRGPATFVFQVEAKKGNQLVYSNVLSLTFDAPGTRQLLVEGLPVGSVVTVKEVYSGTCYTVTTAAEQTVTITPAGDPQQVEFKNDYNGNNRGGTSITNRFEPGESWIWTPATDSTAQ